MKIKEVFDYSGANGEASEVIWNFIDWQGIDGQLKGEDAALTLDCIYCSSLEAASAIFAETDPEMAKSITEKNIKLRETLRNVFRDCTGVCDHAVAAGYLAGALDNVDGLAKKSSDASFSCDIMFLFVFLEALEKAGKISELIQAIRQVFGKILEDGGSTFPETRLARKAASRALCQGVGAIPGYFLLRAFSGVRGIDAVGKKITCCKPYLDEVRIIEINIPTPLGEIKFAANGSKWSRNFNGIDI